MTNSKLDKHLLEILKLIFIVILEMYHSIEIIFFGKYCKPNVTNKINRNKIIEILIYACNFIRICGESLIKYIFL